MSNLKRSIELTLKGKIYTVKFPNVGKMALIESNKAILSNGQYGSMYRMATVAGNDALLMIDVESHLSVLVPQFIEEIRPKQFSELEYDEFAEIAKVYIDVFKPWYDGILKTLRETK
jgi:hypothetical protein